MCSPRHTVASNVSQCRLRATFADMDSSSPSTILATCEYYSHVLNKYNDAELKSVVDVATGKAAWRSAGCISTYKEVQVCVCVWAACVCGFGEGAILPECQGQRGGGVHPCVVCEWYRALGGA